MTATRRRRHGWVWLVLVLAGLWSFSPELTADSAVDQERTAVAVTALKKLQGIDLEQNATLKAAVLRVLEAVRGTPDFVELVQKFNLTGQERGLLDIAQAHPTEDVGVGATRLLLEQNALGDLQTVLMGKETNAAVNLVVALGNTRSGLALPLLEPLLTAPTVPLPTRRQAVLALSQTEAGAKILLEQADTLPPDLHLTASLALNQSRWPEVRKRAAKLLPPHLGRNSEPLPPLTELLARSGDPDRGKELFHVVETGCASCHRVRGVGREIGPDLSEIGSKLGKEALYESILNPSAGISFGYEAWTLELASGDEAYGLIVSETPEAIAIKDTGGIVTQYDKRKVASRRQMKLSLMPTDLQLTMTPDELVDLVEYLASLKKLEAD